MMKQAINLSFTETNDYTGNKHESCMKTQQLTDKLLVTKL